jgi:hypothetical protein
MYKLLKHNILNTLTNNIMALQLCCNVWEREMREWKPKHSDTIGIFMSKSNIQLSEKNPANKLSSTKTSDSNSTRHWITKDSKETSFPIKVGKVKQIIPENGIIISISPGKVVPVLHHAMKVYWGSRGTVLRILDLGTRWGWVVSFMPWPLYPQGKNPWYPLHRRLGGSQSWSGCGGEEKNSQPLLGHKNKKYITNEEVSLQYWKQVYMGKVNLTKWQMFSSWENSEK